MGVSISLLFLLTIINKIYRQYTDTVFNILTTVFIKWKPTRWILIQNIIFRNKINQPFLEITSTRSYTATGLLFQTFHSQRGSVWPLSSNPGRGRRSEPNWRQLNQAEWSHTQTTLAHTKGKEPFMQPCVRVRPIDPTVCLFVCLSTSPNYRVRLSTGHFARNCDFPRVCRAPARYWLQPLPQTRYNTLPAPLAHVSHSDSLPFR